MSPPPRIGLTTYLARAQWGVWDERAALLPAGYVMAVARAGGLPVLLPPIAPGDLDDAAAAAIGGVDGVLLTGGADVDPARYGAEAHPETDRPQEGRDAWELALLRAARSVDHPLLTVCRGTQLLNVALGGTLHQHLPDVIGAPTHRPTLAAFASVPVRVEPESRLAAIVGTAPEAPCHHHQAIDRLGEGLVISARAEDGTVEGVELPDAPFALGVQWHPEEADDGRLFTALVEAADQARSSHAPS